MNSRPAWATYVMFKENVGYIVSGSQPGLYKKPVANLSVYQDPISKKSSMKDQELEMKSQVTQCGQCVLLQLFISPLDGSII